MTPMIISIILILLPSLFTPHTTSRRILHQPFFPVTEPPPPPPPQTTTQPPSPSPKPPPLPKQPFSSITTPITPTHHHNTHDHHFFPLFTTPPTTTTTTIPTFPANFTSITIPSSHQTPSKPHNGSKKLIFLSLTLSLLSIVLISSMVATFLYHRSHHHKPPDNHHLLPPNHQNSDKPPSLPPNSSNPSTEFLYLGTLFSPMHNHASVTNDIMGSPELHPLPPLVRKVHGYVEEGEKVVVTAPPPPPPAAAVAGGSGGGGGVKMKGLYWDKVKGGSDKAMVWDKFKFSSSFR
ncbi:hypothetical protein Tco_1089848 [Tanacetum coccineum]